MKIGAFVKQSFIDWEGKITAVIFLKGCNFRCGYCHNPELVLPSLCNSSDDIDVNQVLDFLSQRKNWLDGVVITGGEPCIHNDLEALVHSIRELGFKIKLDTNGSRPLVLKSLLDQGLIDFVAMDIKTILQKDCYAKICNYHADDLIENTRYSIHLIKNAGIGFQFRTTIIPEYHSTDIIEELKTSFKDCNYSLQEYRDERVLGDIIQISKLAN